MSDLTKEQIEAMREQALSENGSWITQNNLKALCDMALASIDLRARLAQAQQDMEAHQLQAELGKKACEDYAALEDALAQAQEENDIMAQVSDTTRYPWGRI